MELNIHSPLPRRKDFRIGIIGSGFIVNDCHLVAYRRAGFNPVAIASRNRENATRVAERHGIPTVYGSASELLEDPTIEVLDLAVPPNVQLELIKEACARKRVRGILAQKPLGMDYVQAVEAVEACEAAGITLAVNQNMRYDQSVRAAMTLLKNGTLGEPVLATIEMRGIPHWMPWQQEMGWLTLRIMSIHHLDTFRYWFGHPEEIFCSTRTDPRTTFPHSDGICVYNLSWRHGLRAVVIDDTWTGPAREGCPSDIYIRWRIEGLNGLAIGDIGWCKDVYTTPSTIRYAAKGDKHFHSPVWTESWFPDAFIGTMAQLLIALEEGGEPAISGRDNLKTMALVDAAYRSAQEHRAVTPLEIMARGPEAEFEEHSELTERARTALSFGRQEAESLHQDAPGSEHLLAGLLRLGSGVAFTMLGRIEVDLEAIREKMREGPKVLPESQDSDVGVVLANAVIIARRLGHNPAGTEHLFLAILSDETCRGARLLRALGVENTTIRDEILRHLSPG